MPHTPENGKTAIQVVGRKGLTPKALHWANFGHCYFRHVIVIRRCGMIFWEFYDK
jgi:hypothetical protein